MATQVVMFSVLLFGTSGVVLDFGRVYSEHTLMQSYTDQAALAAAAELDGEIDAIQRAKDAVFGSASGNGAPMSATAVFSTGDSNQFNISHLIFVDDMGDDSGAQTSMGDLTSANILHVAFADGTTSGGSAVNAGKDAQYVIAVAEERSVRNSLMLLINAAGSSPVSEDNVVRTVAAARRDNRRCGAFSNLVMCNPWEEAAGESIDNILDDPANAGIQFRHVADGTFANRWSLLRRRELVSDASIDLICNEPLTMPGWSAGLTAAEEATYNTICKLSAAQPSQNVCVGDELEIVPMTAEEATTALNVAFDIWDYPISKALEWGGTSRETDLALFRPDRNVAKGIAYDPDKYTANLANPTLSLPAGETLPKSSRLNYTDTPANGYDLIISQCLRGNLLSQNTCLDNGFADDTGYIGPTRGITGVNEYWATYYQMGYFIAVIFDGIYNAPLDLTSFYLAHDYEVDNWTHATTTTVDPLTGQPVNPGDSFGYQITLSNGTIVREDGNLALTTPGGATHASIIPGIANENYPVSSVPSSPLYISPTDNLERRRMAIGVVNCGQMTVENGITSAPVVDFIDIHLLMPPTANCSGVATTCLNSQLDSADVFMEYITNGEDDEQAYPVLVR
ncbi:MAG: pilus assembly protein TadG-related protein [Pseudomonadota bacterium]